MGLMKTNRLLAFGGDKIGLELKKNYSPENCHSQDWPLFDLTQSSPGRIGCTLGNLLKILRSSLILLLLQLPKAEVQFGAIMWLAKNLQIWEIIYPQDPWKMQYVPGHYACQILIFHF
jgi:hypothetical protein